MKPNSAPQPNIEQLLEQSQPAASGFSPTQKSRIWEMVQRETTQVETEPAAAPMMPVRRYWWLWLSGAVSAGAVAVVLWWLQVEQPNTAQLANTNTAPSVNVPVVTNINNSNEQLNPSTNDTVNINADTTPTTEVTPQLPQSDNLANRLTPRLYHPTVYDYINRGGGGSEYDYSTIQFQAPDTLPTVPTDAVTYERSQLSLPELYHLAEFFGFSSDELTVHDNGTIASNDTFVCPAIPNNMTIDPCLTIAANGSITEFIPNSANRKLADMVSFITKLTGRQTTDYITQDLGLSGDADQYHEYLIYSGTSLLANQTQRDLGWHVITENDAVRLLHGYVQPEFTLAKTYSTISPTEALARLQAAFQPYDRSTNINTARIWINGFQLSDLFKENNQPNIIIANLTLEYSLGQSRNGTLALVPVYYMKGYDTDTNELLEVYIEATTDTRLLADYTLLRL